MRQVQTPNLMVVGLALFLLSACQQGQLGNTIKGSTKTLASSGPTTTITTTTTRSTTTTTRPAGSTTTTSRTTTTTQGGGGGTTTTSRTTTTTFNGGGGGNGSGGYCSTGGAYEGGGCNEGNCRCFVNLGKAINGTNPDMNQINQYLGSNDPRNVFMNGGSENIPVTCRAAKYWVDGDPAWFEEYIGIQIDPNSGFGLLGRELFSNTYTSLNVGVVISVLEKARRRGHTNLINKINRFLKAYWSILALSAHNVHNAGSRAYQYNQSTGTDTPQGQPNSGPASSGIAGGFGLVLPGNRSYVNSRGGGVGLQYTLLSMALAHGSRKWDWSIDMSPGYYGGLCASMRSLGYSFNSDGKPTNFRTYDPGPERFGLTSSDRQELTSFISSNGSNGLNSILQTLSGIRLECNYMIVRTSSGITAWFGNDTGVTQLCSRSKGGSYVAGTLLFSDRYATYLSRATAENQPEAADTWKEGEQICEQTASRPRRCVDIAPGSVVYRIRWPAGGAPSN